MKRITKEIIIWIKNQILWIRVRLLVVYITFSQQLLGFNVNEGNIGASGASSPRGQTVGRPSIAGKLTDMRPYNTFIFSLQLMKTRAIG